MVNKDEFDGNGNKTKIMSTSSIFKKLIGADYLISGTRKAFNHMQYKFT